jgi:type IV pilus assembly protein PilC
VPYLLDVWNTIATLALICIPIFLVIRALLTTEAGREAYDQVKLLVPVIGPLVRKLAVSRFARTLAALYGAGVPIMTSVSIAGETCGNHVLESATRRSLPAIEHGVSITQTLTASGFFQPMFLGMVSTGETSGNLDQMLDKAAAFYEEEAQHSTVQLVTILSVVLLLVAAILVAIKIISFYTGFYGGVTGGAGGAAPNPAPNGIHAPAGGDTGE